MKLWISIVILMKMVCASLPCSALMRIPSRTPNAVSVIRTPTKVLVLSLNHPDFSHGFNAAAIQPVQTSTGIESDDVSMMIPQDMRPTSDGGQVAARIVDRSLTSWFNSPSVRNSRLGRTARTVETSLNSDMNIGGSEEDSIKHSLKFNVKAAQTKALLNYEGLTNAQLSYQVAASTLDFEIREPMQMLSTDFVYNHTATRLDNRDVVSVRWVW